MGRRAKYSREDITAAARELIAEEGPRAATIAAIAARLGAPSGSIYHRYRSRELLLADVWLTTVESFQDQVVALLQSGLRDVSDRGALLSAGVEMALFMPRWVRANLPDARLLLQHRREDFVAGRWPVELVERAGALRPQLGAALRAYCKRLFGAATKANLQRCRFALLDMPFGAVKPYVVDGSKPPPLVDELIRTSCMAALAGGNSGVD